MWNKIAKVFIDYYWQCWQIAHGIDTDNPPVVDINSLPTNYKVQTFGHKVTYVE